LSSAERCRNQGVDATPKWTRDLEVKDARFSERAALDRAGRAEGVAAIAGVADLIIYSFCRERLDAPMRSQEDSLFTATEAAVLTRLPLKAVHNAIDKKTVATVAGARSGQAARLLDLHGLMSLTLERRLADRFAPELRRAVVDAVAGNSRNRMSLEGGFLTIDLREPRRELAASLRKLRRARALVISNPDILRGDPVFRGTRVPVHLIATLLEQGSTERDLLEGYPRLTAEMVALAPIYAAAYPLRGRPRTQPWHDKAPKRTTRRKLATIAAE